MLTPIALQLYTLREALAKDFNGVIKQIADTGYIGVEPAGLYGGKVEDGARLFNDLGLTVCSAHMPLPLGAKKTEVLETMAALNCKRMVIGGTPRDLKTLDQVKQAADSFNEASAVAVENGLTFGIHNHWWEFGRVEDGRTAFEVLREYLAPAVLFEVDVYWVKTGGVDPAVLVKELGQRAPLLHLKDGPCLIDQPMVALGDGIVDLPGVVKAGEGSAEWLIVELDQCATDMLEAVKKSYRYLIEKGLAHGNKN
jgi:sugar phosphate isomerase/epimerase